MENRNRKNGKRSRERSKGVEGLTKWREKRGSRGVRVECNKIYIYGRYCKLKIYLSQSVKKRNDTKLKKKIVIC